MTSNTAAPAAGLEARAPEKRPARTPEEIEADIERTRVRLAGTVDAIAERVKPGNVARRGVAAAKRQLVDEQGNLRTVRVAAVAVAVAGTAGFLVWRRSR